MDKLTIEEFRQEVYPGLAKKGIEPPEPNSRREIELYQRWLKGSEKLEALRRSLRNG